MLQYSSLTTEWSLVSFSSLPVSLSPSRFQLSVSLKDSVVRLTKIHSVSSAIIKKLVCLVLKNPDVDTPLYREQKSRSQRSQICSRCQSEPARRAGSVSSGRDVAPTEFGSRRRHAM